MTWRRVGLYWALFAAALVLHRVSEKPPRIEVPDTERVMLVGVPPDFFSEFRLIRGDRHVSCRREVGHWKVVHPPGVRVPADLLETFVSTLVEVWAKEVIELGTEGLGPYGLGHGALRVELYQRGHDRPIVVRLGGRNPTETALYAQVDDGKQILVVGRVLAYYARRIFEEVEDRSSRRVVPAIDDERAPSTG